MNKLQLTLLQDIPENLMRTFLLITLISFGLGATALTPNSYAADCANAIDQSTLNACAEKDYKKSDAELNKLYKDIRIRLSDQPDTVKKLVSAQRAWIAFRDAECDFATLNTQGGSAYGMLVSMCRDGLTQARIKEFKTYLSCEEGDMSCPVPPKD